MQTMLKAAGLALCLVLGAAACNGILGNSAASATDEHLFDQDAASEAGDSGAALDAANSNDVAPGSDAGTDAPAADAASLACGAPAFVNTCLDCAGKTSLCADAGTCVADCHAECGGSTGSPVECIGCDDAGVVDTAVCEPPTTPSACLVGHRRCRCPGGVADCPGNAQVCVSNICHACGESSTDAVTCKANGACDTATGSAAKYSCH